LPKKKQRIIKSVKGNPLKRGFPWFVWLAIGLGILAIAIIAFVLVRNSSTCEQYTQYPSDELRCAIVDQFSDIETNQTFVTQASKVLSDYGFKVDVYRKEDITVDFYRGLACYGYKLIILRVHAGVLENEERVRDSIWLFTTEPYQRLRYYMAQLRDQVTVAKTSDTASPVFAVGARFVKECTVGEFAGTTIINMGCATFYSDELARAFVEKGAAAYMGWDASVGLYYVDDAALTLIEKLCLEKLTVAEAVTETIKEKGLDPNNRAVLKYYPPLSADRTLNQILEPTEP
jgi:hypothetical protein